MGEFDLIARYFKRPVRRVALGVGDDCALLAPTPGTQLAVSSDMLLQGRHFLPGTDPTRLGHKALAVNLSDLAACGAQPLAFTLALALAQPDEAWLAAFSNGLLTLADAHGCELMGGDTTAGALAICITVVGEVPLVQGQSQALLRSGAQAGDDLYVSGTLGDAALALQALQGRVQLPTQWLTPAQARLEQPTPRVALGLALRGVANAAIDVSDGLLGDLQHLLDASGVGATVDVDVATSLIAVGACASSAEGQFDTFFSLAQRRQWALAGGDDYELLFCAAPARQAQVQQAAQASATPVTRIGRIDAEPGVRLQDAQGQPVPHRYNSFDHFA